MKSLIAALGTLLMLVSGSTLAADFKVLVVMSYEEDNPWVREIREGIDGVLLPAAEITYFHMNTKANRDGGPARAEEASALFKSLQPNGVITADDDAVAMFILPYLKDKTATPVMFNGVNAAAEKYGFPNAHVSGVLERAHVRESLAFIKQILPSVRKACFMTADVPPGRALRSQVDAEKATYPISTSDFYLIRDNQQLEGLGKSLNANCDLLFVDSLEGILDRNGKTQTNKDVFPLIQRIFNKPILGANRYQVEQGALAAVVKTGQEQGERSAEMLLQAMRGKSVSSLPVTQNSRGQRVINVSALERMGIMPQPSVLRGAALVRQQP
ncbi:MAG: ABC transporter substrate-binding protein [Betaproteobacteria bacterium]|nr:ABC transporter substrate-binding protein [Betaproteobacteria bacterium]MBP6187353.1 hypothetical protein [Azonexus sp.]MBP6202063.1 hypothetical protein [Azonexus sp.]